MKFRILFPLIVVASLSLHSTRAWSALEPVTLTSEDSYPAPRWMFGQGEVPAGESGWALMAQAKHAQLGGDFVSCLKKIEGAWPKAKNVQSWLAATELDCAVGALTGEGAVAKIAKLERVHRALARVEKNPAWLLTGPQAETLRTSLIDAYLASLEADVKTNRVRAAKTVDRLEELEAYAEDPERAKLWRLAGELAFQNQNTSAARELLRRSLHEQDTDEARIRLTQIESTLGSDAAAKAQGDQKAATKAMPNPQLEASKEELELVERVTSSMRNGELVSAVDDAVKLIHGFPGGSRAKWAAERASDAYWSVAERFDPKYVLTRGQMLKLMQGADADRIYDWAKSMFSRGQWDDALTLATVALDATAGARSTPIIELCSKAAIATDRFDTARKMLDRLVLQNAGTQAAREALFRSGLLHYRQKEYGQAASDLERLLAFPAIDRLEVSVRYWLWRSLQRSNRGQRDADAAADELLRRFPFSYYGLRARLERSGNALEWKPETGKISAKLWLTKAERGAWERAQLLLRAGWLDEAQAELRELPPPIKAEDKAVRAIIWAASARYTSASKLANEAWDEVPDLRRPPVVAAAFPTEFSSLIETQAESRKLDHFLVRGLIKQESSFNVRAVSPANALGLMQLVPGTAREVASELRLGALKFPADMFQAARNIQMGSYYLGKLIAKYSGHIPLALAAYNAGPTRIDRWLKTRASLKDLALSRSSAPENELWFDELPYMETSIYVKAILRNILIYKMLDKGRVQIPDPVWSESAKTAP